MDLGNEARAAATNAQLLLASAPLDAGPSRPSARRPDEQRVWLPSPALHGVPPPVTALPVGVWPHQWPWQLVAAGWRPPDGQGTHHDSRHPPRGRDDGVEGASEPEEGQRHDRGGQAAAANGKVRQQQAGSARSLNSDSVSACGALQPAAAGGRASPLKPSSGQALVDLQIDGSGRAPAAAPPAAHEAAPHGGQKLQTVNRGHRGRGRTQRETLRGSQPQRWPLRRVRNWNDTLDA